MPSLGAWLMVCLGGGAAGLVFYRQRKGGAPVADVKAQAGLKTLAKLWREEKQVLKVAQLATLWRKPESGEGEEAEPDFKHDIALGFFRRHMKGKKIFEGLAGKAVMELLKLLDEEGDCPSVVPTGVKADPEAAIAAKDRNTYDIFSHYTLLEHSLHVAEESHRIFGDGPDLAEAFVAAFGHDVGKLEKYRDSLYALGDHPMLSTAVLGEMASIKALPNREEILQAIRTHHGQGKIKEEDTFAKMFYEADKAARLREIGEYAARNGARAANPVEAILGEAGNFPPVADEKPVAGREAVEERDIPPHMKAQLSRMGFKVKDKPPPDSLPPEVMKAKAAATLEGDNDTGKPTTKHGGAAKQEIKKAEIPWFRSDLFLAKIKPIINKVGPFGGKWKAISMRDGYVYVQTGFLWDIAREIGTQYGDNLIKLGEADQGIRQEVLLGVVSALREEGHIATNLIKDGYIGGKFTLKVKTPQGQKEFSYYLTPFMAEAFSSTVSALEEAKEGHAKNVIGIAPDFKNA